MDSQNPGVEQDSRPEDRRRSKRFPLEIPVSLKWIGLDGLPTDAEGRAVEGSDHGGLLEIGDPPPFGKEAVLTNRQSGKTIMVQVLSLRTTKEAKVRGLAVQFLSPNKAFWGTPGQVGEEFAGGIPEAAPPSLASRCKSLLHSLLGRPRM